PRAEADAAAAERRTGDDRGAAEQLRAELAQVRHEAAEERAALRAEAREQLDAVLTRFATTEQSDTSSTPTPSRRGRGKSTE
ncbi:MAG: hypothetical protein ACRDRH_28530, partial [Pseudonocardia sp.]